LPLHFKSASHFIDFRLQRPEFGVGADEGMSTRLDSCVKIADLSPNA